MFKQRPFFLAYAVGAVYMAFSITSSVLHDIFSVGDVFSAAVVDTSVILFTWIWLFIDRVFEHKHIYSEKMKNGRNLPKYRTIINMAILSLNIMTLVTTISQITTVNMAPRLSAEYSVKTHENLMTIIDSLCVIWSAIFCIVLCQLTWWPAPRAARTVLMMCGVVEFVVGTMMIVINHEILEVGERGDKMSNRDFRFSLLFQNTGSAVVACAVMAVALCMILRENDRLNPVLSRLIQVYMVFTALVMVLNLVSFGLSLHALTATDYEQPGTQYIFLHANPGLSGSFLALSVAHIIAASKIQKRPPSFLSVEVFDLNSLTQAQCEAYAALIDRYGIPYAGAPSGSNAVALMKSYSAVKNNDMSCQVLRVYRPKKNPKADDEQSWPLSNRKVPRSYDEIAAWGDLDKEAIIPQYFNNSNSSSFSTTTTLADDTRDETKSVDTLQPAAMSKNQQKRLAKKNNKKNKKGPKFNTVQFPLEKPKSPEELRKELEFNEQLMSTEALVLLTKIEKYDLTASMKGKFGRVCQKLLGEESLLKPLVVRMGLLGFHWPFRQSTFYCSNTKRPVARSAAILRAITEWNTKLPRKEQCRVMMDPRYQNDESERAITPSGWHKLPLPASHIADLRQFRGKSLQEYLKAIKYRNQAPAFNRADGKVTEVRSDFSDEQSEQVMQLWHKIAEKRTAEGHTAVLAEPTAKLIKEMGNHGSQSLLFLSVDHKPIASCVLFRLGDTITSDLQGLDHELARQYKAYFVMMQHTIEIALKENISFVDFGPTTSKPKLDIGCQSVPLMGGITSTSPLLNLGIKMAVTGLST